MTARRWALVLAPLVVSAISCVVLAATMPGASLVMRASLALVPLWVGLVVSAVVGVVLGLRARRERLRAEREAALAAVAAEAGERGRAIEHDAHRRFVARLDHELKNPLTAIRAAVAGLAAGVSSGGPLPDVEQARLLETIDGQSARIASLVADLRKVGELERAELEWEVVDSAQLVAEAVEDVVQASVGVGGGTRRVELALPRAPWPLPPVRGDVDLLHLALTNVIGNAVKYSAPDSVVEVRGSEQGGWVAIEVADTGLGVPADELPIVFDELARSSRTRHLPGTGIGLSLVRIVVERHGGTVEIRSREGTGTAVTLRLPVDPR